MYSDEQRTYIDFVIGNVEKEFVVGAEFHKLLDGRYQNYKVASLYYCEDYLKSKNDVMNALLPRLMDEVDCETKWIIFRSNMDLFKYRKKDIRRRIEFIAHDRGYHITLRSVANNLALKSLANDALIRKSDCIAKL